MGVYFVACMVTIYYATVAIFLPLRSLLIVSRLNIIQECPVTTGLQCTLQGMRLLWKRWQKS